ncbi:hypothetical protein FHX59_001022 [Paraburkholderia silvatlantica]|nr:hypothetical protein [Paraburkholderia silvatlantica]
MAMPNVGDDADFVRVHDGEAGHVFG